MRAVACRKSCAGPLAGPLQPSTAMSTEAHRRQRWPFFSLLALLTPTRLSSSSLHTQPSWFLSLAPFPLCSSSLFQTTRFPLSHRLSIVKFHINRLSRSFCRITVLYCPRPARFEDSSATSLTDCPRLTQSIVYHPSLNRLALRILQHPVLHFYRHLIRVFDPTSNHLKRRKRLFRLFSLRQVSSTAASSSQPTSSCR